MIPRTVFLEHKEMALAALRKNRIYISADEAASIEIADFGLSKPRVIGIQTFVLIKTDRICLKIIVLLPHQICREHKHSILHKGEQQGKEESVRILDGTLLFYQEGPASASPMHRVPEEYRDHFIVFHETVLSKGMKLTIEPATWHWFQAGSDGAIIENISTKTIDEEDLFRDPHITRIPQIGHG